MNILAIETSCDETSIALLSAETEYAEPHFRVRSHITLSQTETHKTFGGVVPNLAKRDHQKNLPIIFQQSLNKAGITPTQRTPSDTVMQTIARILEREQNLLEQFNKEIATRENPEIDYIAVTAGPGLEPALWVGVNFAKALAALWDIPIIPVNHMEGHIYSSLLEEENITSSHSFTLPSIQFPALVLLVSGGHTELVLIKEYGTYEVIGETQDDAAGEAFDKVARLLGLEYPGGPAISAVAEHVQNAKSKILNNITLPRPMLHSGDYHFSFSGLKTAVMYMVKEIKENNIPIEDARPAIAKEFQDAAVEVLKKKTLRAAETYGAQTLLVGGGVSANKVLRSHLSAGAEKHNIPLYIAPLSVTGDNALMIALAAYMNRGQKTTAYDTVQADAHMSLSRTTEL